MHERLARLRIYIIAIGAVCKQKLASLDVAYKRRVQAATRARTRSLTRFDRLRNKRAAAIVERVNVDVVRAKRVGGLVAALGERNVENECAACVRLRRPCAQIVVVRAQMKRQDIVTLRAHNRVQNVLAISAIARAFLRDRRLECARLPIYELVENVGGEISQV